MTKGCVRLSVNLEFSSTRVYVQSSRWGTAILVVVGTLHPNLGQPQLPPAVIPEWVLLLRWLREWQMWASETVVFATSCIHLQGATLE